MNRAMNDLKSEEHEVRDDRSSFLHSVEEAVAASDLLKLTLGKYRGGEQGMKNLYVTPVMLKGKRHYSLVSHYSTRDVTRNIEPSELLPEVNRLIGNDFRSGHLYTSDRETHLEFSKKGRTLLRSRRTAANASAASKKSGASEGSADSEGDVESTLPRAATDHDRPRNYLLSPDLPFLHGLGVTDATGNIIPSMSRKWRQINKFVEIVDGSFERSPLRSRSSLHVVDFGSGKGYLTTALHEYLRRKEFEELKVTGVELRPDLVELCNEVAGANGLEGLEFIEGDILNVAPERIDMMIALHACDTATDLALYRGITAGASIIMAAPCCHKEVRPQITIPTILSPVLRYGVHMGAEADMLTDSIRASLLESHGYDVSIFEFVSLEHTGKNRMILAVQRERRNEEKEEKERQGREELMTFFGIERQRLNDLLSQWDNGGDAPTEPQSASA